jgi:multiple sugar transport system permease protein
MTKYRITLWDIIKILILAAGVVVTVFPFYWMIICSLRDLHISYLMPPKLLLTQFKWENYVKAWTVYPYGRAYINTFIVCVSEVILSLLTSSMAAYSFAKLRFPGKKVIFSLLLSLMMVPFTVTMIPVYLIMRQLHLYNSLSSLIIPGALLSAGGVFLLRQFILGVPNDYSEAAIIEGASFYRVFFQIILPMIKSALISLGIFVFLGSYNNFLMPMILLKDIKKYTVPIFLAQMKGIYTVDMEIAFASAAIAVVPVIVVYCFAQRYIIEGISLTGIKA